MPSTRSLASYTLFHCVHSKETCLELYCYSLCLLCVWLPPLDKKPPQSREPSVSLTTSSVVPRRLPTMCSTDIWWSSEGFQIHKLPKYENSVLNKISTGKRLFGTSVSSQDPGRDITHTVMSKFNSKQIQFSFYPLPWIHWQSNVNCSWNVFQLTLKWRSEKRNIRRNKTNLLTERRMTTIVRNS